MIGCGRRSAGRIALRRVNHFESPLFGTRDDEPSIGGATFSADELSPLLAVRLRELSVSPINSLSAARISHQTRIHHRRRFTSVKIPAEWNLNDTRERFRWRREPFSYRLSNLIMIRSCRGKSGGRPTIFLWITSCRMGQPTTIVKSRGGMYSLSCAKSQWQGLRKPALFP